MDCIGLSKLTIISKQSVFQSKIFAAIALVAVILSIIAKFVEKSRKNKE